MQGLTEPARQRAGRRWQPGRRRAAAIARRGSEAGGARRRVLAGLMAVSATALLAVPVALGAAPPQPLPAQRIDMKVLLIGNVDDGRRRTTPGRRSSSAPACRSTSAAPTPGRSTDATLADYGANRAKYQAVIIVAATDSEPDRGRAAALTKFEETFGIRQISDNVVPGRRRTASTRPDPVGRAGRHHRAAHRGGQGRVPLPQGPRAAAARRHDGVDVFGYQATPLAGANFTTLLTGPNNSAYLGINVRAERHRGDGQHRPGQPVPEPPPAAARRDARLGDARRLPRLRAQLPRARHRRRLPARRQVGSGQQRHGLQRDHPHGRAATSTDAVDLAEPDRPQAEHGLQHGRHRSRRAARAARLRLLAGAFKAHKNEFRWINHTYAHPNLDCTTPVFTTRADHATTRPQFDTQPRARSRPGSTTRPSSSPVSTPAWPTLIPGNPGTIDPPFFVEATAGAAGSGTLAAGTLRVRHHGEHGERARRPRPFTHGRRGGHRQRGR